MYVLLLFLPYGFSLTIVIICLHVISVIIQYIFQYYFQNVIKLKNTYTNILEIYYMHNCLLICNTFIIILFSRERGCVLNWLCLFRGSKSICAAANICEYIYILYIRMPIISLKRCQLWWWLTTFTTCQE